MPHRSADQTSPTPHGYSPHETRGRSYQQQPPAVHMIHHPAEAARMVAYQQHAHQAYGGTHPAYHGHHMPPPVMWHPADAASHLTRTEMGHASEPVVSHAVVENQSAKRLRTVDTMESAEEAAASALLMASGMTKPGLTEIAEQQGDAGSISEPLKKRQALEVETKVDPTTGSACHVSPGSASSREGDTHTDESVTIVTQSSRTFLEASSGSYDTREMKKDDVLHFPSVLHKVLDMPEVNSVLQWLPNGEAWKIVRWDALRREVLPRYFPELCKGKQEGSMDSFLAQVRAWGFEEINDGPDAGAYRNLSFIRDTPKLCKNMTRKEPASPRQLPDTKSPGSVDSRSKGKTKAEGASILQVPSLTSRSDGEQEPKEMSIERQDTPSTNNGPTSLMHTPNAHDRISPVVHPGWHHGGMAMSYRTRDGGYADPRRVTQSSPLRHGVTFPPPYSPRFPFRTPGGPPSPLVKSGRGGSRLASRGSFPVSQRGRGGRARIASSPITTPNSEESSVVTKNDSIEEQPSPGLGPHLEKSLESRPEDPEEGKSTGLGPHLQKDTSKISRKMTRKLPLTRKQSPVENEEDRDPVVETSQVNEESSS